MKREVAMKKLKIDLKIKSRLSVLYFFVLLISILFYFIPGSGIEANTSTKKYTYNTLNVNNSKSSFTPYLYWEEVFSFYSTTHTRKNISVFQNLIMSKDNLLSNNITYSSGILTVKI